MDLSIFYQPVLIEDATIPGPIARLPPELVAAIIYWYNLSLYNTRPLEQSVTSAWLLPRHICSAWRHAALTTPQISAFICLLNPLWVQETLVRAGPDLSLHIYEPTPCFSDPDAAFEMRLPVLEQFARIENAAFSLDERGVQLVSSNLSGGPLRPSRLRSLELRFRVRPALWQSITLLFAGFTFTDLITLSFSYGSVRAMAPTLAPSLRRLHIQKPERVSPAYVAEALAPLVQLEELVLDEVFGRSFQPTMWPLQPPAPLPRTLSLPHLRRLDIHDSHSHEGAQLLQHTSYPATASLRVHLDSFAPQQLCDLAAETVAVKLCTLAAEVSLRSVLLRMDQDLNGLPIVRITAWVQRLSLEDLRAEGSASAAIFDASLTLLPAAIAGLQARLTVPLSEVETALMSEPVPVSGSASYWAAAASALENVEELGVERGSHGEHSGFALAQEVVPIGWAPGETVPESERFRKLRTLEVYEVQPTGLFAAMLAGSVA